MIEPGDIVRYGGQRDSAHRTIGIVIEVDRGLCTVLWNGGTLRKLYVQHIATSLIDRVN